MKIIEVNTEEFNKMTFPRRELSLKDTAMNLVAMAKWADRHKAKVIYKYKRATDILWMVEEK